MENVTLYKNIILTILEEFANDWNNSSQPLEYEIIADEKRQRFQLVCLGWVNEKYTHFTIFHIDIRNGKVWIQENRTDIKIAQELTKRGIPKTDIVLGIQPPELRKYSEYAVA